MKTLLSICFILSLAVASLASAVSKNDSISIDALGATESPIDSATEGGSVEVNDSTELNLNSHGIESRNRRQFDMSGILQMVFQFFIQVLTSTFGMIPQTLSPGIMNQMGNVVAGAQKQDPTPDLAGDNDSITIVDDSKPTTEAPQAAAYRRRQQQARVQTYRAGGKVNLVAPKSSYRKIQTYKKANMKAPCNHYLRTISSETNPTRKQLVGHYCLKFVGK